MCKKIVVITGSPRENGNSIAMTDAGKECMLIACCEEEDMSVLDGVRIPMERMTALMKWHMAGEVLIPGVLHTGDIEQTDGRRQAAALAEKI